MRVQKITYLGPMYNEGVPEEVTNGVVEIIFKDPTLDGEIAVRNGVVEIDVTEIDQVVVHSRTDDTIMRRAS